MNAEAQPAQGRGVVNPITKTPNEHYHHHTPSLPFPVPVKTSLPDPHGDFFQAPSFRTYRDTNLSSGESSPVLLSPTKEHNDNKHTQNTCNPKETFLRSHIMESLHRQASAIIFTGRDRDTTAQEYLDMIEAVVDTMPMDDEVKLNRQRVFLFRQGVRRDAKAWYSTLPYADRSDWVKLQALFLKKFPDDAEKPIDQQAVADAMTFQRKNGETLSDFLHRAAKIRNRLPYDFVHQLVLRVFTHMNDGEIDLHLKGRVQDRMYADKKINSYNQPKSDVTFEEMARYITMCAEATTAHLEPESDTDDDDPVAIIRKMVESNKELNGKMMDTFKESMAAVTMQYAREQGRRNNCPNPGNQDNGAPRPRQGNPDFMWCFNCAEWGHGSRDCPKPRSSSWEKNREKWDKERQQMLQQRREQLGKKTVNFTTLPTIIPRRVTELDDEDDESMEYRGSTSVTNVTAYGMQGEILPARYRRGAHEKTDYDRATQKARIEHATSNITTKTQVQVPEESYPVTRNKGKASQRWDPYTHRPDKAERQQSHPGNENPRATPSSSRTQDIDEDTPVPDAQDGPRRTQASSRDGENGAPASDDDVREIPRPARKQDTTQGPRNLKPIRGTVKYDVPQFSIGDVLSRTDIHLSALQLLQISPLMRSETNYLIQTADPQPRKRKANIFDAKVSLISKADVSARHALKVGNIRDTEILDVAWPINSDVPTSLGYIEGTVDHVKTNMMLLDSGSTTDVISLTFVERHEFRRVKLMEPLLVRLADNQVTEVKNFCLVEVVTGGIRTTVQAYILGRSDEWDLLLGKQWHRRVGAVVDHQAETLSVRGLSGRTAQIPIKPSPKMIELWEKLHTPYDSTQDVDGDEDDEEILRSLEERLDASYHELHEPECDSENY